MNGIFKVTCKVTEGEPKLIISACINDNSLALLLKRDISKNLVMHTKTKHIAIKYHYLRELVLDKEVRMEYVNTKEQIADIFTKPLPKYVHEYLRGKLGVIPLSKAT